MILEVVERLRWARALQRRGLSVAPPPAGRYKPKHIAAHVQEDNFIATYDWRLQTFARLKSPEQLAASVSAHVLEAQLVIWEQELTTWGVAIWDKLGETLRLRDEDAKLRAFIEQQQRFDPNISDAKAAILYERISATPNKVHATKAGVAAQIYSPCDEFGNEIEGELDPETLKEFSRGEREDRELRRVYLHERKKAQGGLGDIAEALLLTEEEQLQLMRTNDVGDASSVSKSRERNVSSMTAVQIVVRKVTNADSPTPASARPRSRRR